MRETRIDIRELFAGGFAIALGASAVWIAQDYPFGTLRRMGPGFSRPHSAGSWSGSARRSRPAASCGPGCCRAPSGAI